MSQVARTISKGRALYDFAGNAEQRQLSFKAGDVINITSQFDNGWWAGELNGKVGYLPATYVQLITAAEQRGAPAPGAVPGGTPIPTVLCGIYAKIALIQLSGELTTEPFL